MLGRGTRAPTPQRGHERRSPKELSVQGEAAASFQVHAENWTLSNSSQGKMNFSAPVPVLPKWFLLCSKEWEPRVPPNHRFPHEIFFLKRFFRFYWVWDIFGGEMITCVCHDEVESWSCSLVFEQRSLLMSWHLSEGTLSTWNGVKKRSAIISVIPTSLWTTYFAMHCVTRHRRAFVDSYRYLSHILYL